MELYLVINNVENLPQGLYHYESKTHSLRLLEEANLKNWITKVSLGQEMLATANFVVIKTGRWDRVRAYGDRGFRHLYLMAGAVGENLYLMATSMGLGACGVGSFFDDAVAAKLDLNETQEIVLHITCIGTL